MTSSLNKFNRKAFEFLVFLFLINKTYQQVLGKSEGGIFKNEWDLLNSTEDLFNGIKFGKLKNTFAIEWLQQRALGIVCNAKFESKVNVNLQKWHKTFCDQMENGKNWEEAAENVKEFAQNTEFVKPKMDKKQIFEKIQGIPFLDAKNKGNVAILMDHFLTGADKFYEIVKTKNLLPPSSRSDQQHQHKAIATTSKRRKKRMDNNGDEDGTAQMRRMALKIRRKRVREENVRLALRGFWLPFVLILFCLFISDVIFFGNFKLDVLITLVINVFLILSLIFDAFFRPKVEPILPLVSDN